MSKNTILAFLLIFLTVWFFSNPSYYKFIYKNIFHTTYQEKNEKKELTKSEEPQKPSTAEQQSQTTEDTASVSKKNETIGTQSTPAAADTANIVKSDTVWVQTDKMMVGIDQSGARIVSIKMKEYTYQNRKNKSEKNWIELLPDNSNGGSQLSISGQSFDNRIFQTESEKNVIVRDNKKENIAFTYTDKGNEVTKVYTFENGTYKIGLIVIRNGMTEQPITIGWNAGIKESEQTSSSYGSQMDPKKVHLFSDNNMQHIMMKKAEADDITGFYKWLGITSKYFLIALVADSVKDADIHVQGRNEKANTAPDNKKNIEVLNYSLSYKTTATSDTQSFWFYTGPTKYDELNKYKLKFDQVLFPVIGWPRVFFWADKWFPPVAEFILWILLALVKIVKDYGVAIILLTILSRVVTYPLTQSSMKSMNRMKDVQPKITAIRQKYKSNPQKMNQEIMALYKQEGINPLNPGCLPIFLQMPVFIALFVVLRKAIELRGAGTVLIPWVHDLSQPEVLFALPGAIPLYGSNFALMPIVMAVLTFIQNKMTIKVPNQKAMIYMMPVIMLFLFNNFPSGLVLYWTFSNALGIVQQYYTNKSSEARIKQQPAPVKQPQRISKKK